MQQRSKELLKKKSEGPTKKKEQHIVRSKRVEKEENEEEIKAEDLDYNSTLSLAYDFPDKEELKRNKRRKGFRLDIPRSMTLRGRGGDV